MKERLFVPTFFGAGCLMLLVTVTDMSGQDLPNPESIRPAPEEGSPDLDHNYPDRVFWGDTHVHQKINIGLSLGPAHTR